MDGVLRLLAVALLAFFSELLSSVFGGGYGTILAPALVLMGYDLSLAVPSTLISQLTSSILLALLYHRLGIIKIGLKTEDMKIAGILASCGLIGIAIATLALISLPEVAKNTYVGLVVLAVGIFVLIKRNSHTVRPSLKKIVVVGILSAFNKGLSGGGYGPLVSGGQVASGASTKSAIGRTLLAETVICTNAILMYLWLEVPLDWGLVLAATLGSLLTVPLSAYLVNRASDRALKLGMGLIISGLGASMLVKLILTSLS